jgi:hypothetical protein
MAANRDIIEVLGVVLACEAAARQEDMQVVHEDAFIALADELGRGTVTSVLTLGGFIENDFDAPPLYRYIVSHNMWKKSRVRLPTEYKDKRWVGASSTLMADGSTLVCGANDRIGDRMGFVFHATYYQKSGPIETVSFDNFRDEDARTYLSRSNASLVTLHSGKVLRLGGRVDNRVYGELPLIASNAVYDPDKRPFSPPRFTNQLSDFGKERKSLVGGEWDVLDVGTELPWATVCVVLKSGDVLISGGIIFMGSERVRAACLVYYPRENRFLRTGDMVTPRAHHAGCLLPNGRVFVCGGISAAAVSRSRVTTCEEYDPTSGVWSQLPGELVERMGHTCTLLNSGEIFVVGGWDVEQRCELYDPYLRWVRFAASLPVRASGFITVPVSE